MVPTGGEAAIDPIADALGVIADVAGLPADYEIDWSSALLLAARGLDRRSNEDVRRLSAATRTLLGLPEGTLTLTEACSAIQARVP